MAVTITVNGVDRTSVVVREECEWSDSAYLGEVASGRLVIHDTAGTIAIPSHKLVTVVESTATPTRVWTGYTSGRGITRGPFDVGAAREIRVRLVDLNSLLSRRIFTDSDAKRPKETINARMAWLLASSEVSGLFTDEGAVASSTVEMDKADFIGSRPGDVLGAMARAARFNYYLRWHATSTASCELVFRDDNTSTADTSAASITNTGADSATSFAPNQDAELDVDGDDVWSGAYATYSKGRVYRTRAATATAFASRDGTTEDTGIKLEATAVAAADIFLEESATEEQTLPVRVRQTAAQVNLFQAGDRISTRMTHLATEGWDPAIHARALRRTVTHPLNTDFTFDVALDLSPPEPALPANACPDATVSGTFYPLGGAGNTPNASDGVIYYWRAGVAYPTEPPTGWIGSWHFPAYGAGGAGSTDYMGDCVQSRLLVCLVGNGTAVVKTERYQGVAKPVTLVYGGAVVASGLSGASLSYEITDTAAGDCFRIIELRDAAWPSCGGKVGFSQVVWTAA